MTESRFLDLVRWMVTRRPERWPERESRPPGPPPPSAVDRDVVRITFIGHATCLIQAGGVAVLTDPVWSERASPFTRLGPRRYRPPGIRMADLPELDAVFVSHNHYDHMDVRTLRTLQGAQRAPLVVPLGNARYLERKGVHVAAELDWGECFQLPGAARLWATPAQHWSNRARVPRNAALWASCLLETPAGRVYFAGDSGYGPHLEAVRRLFGPVRLALLPIGAYEPRWFMRPSHMNPGEAVRAARDLEAGTSVATHFGTFRLTDEGQDDPVRDLEAALDEAGSDSPRFWVLREGEGREVP
jgi:L-ascorbate metabolism protein UlaG (beta-lactamase superfamily)